VKLDLRAFRAPCAIVRATMCLFVGHKYDGGVYRVWDPQRRVVVEYRDIVFFVFFDHGLLSSTLNDLLP